jgi:hypothetical protein
VYYPNLCSKAINSSPARTATAEPTKDITGTGKGKCCILGETHNNPEDQKAQLEILQALHQQNRKIAIAMEMFQRPFQDVLDQYLAGKITEAQLVEQTEYEKRWGFLGKTMHRYFVLLKQINCLL